MKEITIKLQLNLLEYFWGILRFQIMTTLREDFVSCYYSLILFYLYFGWKGYALTHLLGSSDG